MRPDETRVAYDGDFIRVSLERWGDSEREIVEHPGAVAVVAVDADDRVVLVRQRREPARRELVELPAGVIEDGEEPLATAQRELAEETGLHGGRWREIAAFWSSPGFLRERITLFLAEELDEGDAAPDGDEQVALVRWPVAELPHRLAEVEDAKTLAGLLWLARERRA